MSPTERFWFKVARRPGNGCWPWLGRRDRDGYGITTYPRNGSPQITVGAHRLSWEMHNGPIPVGMQVLHHCDNPPCVRPSCLFIGSNLDNSNDKVAKGRHPHGEGNGRAKLTEAQVHEARALCASGMSHLAVARHLGVARATVGDLMTRRTWGHIRDPRDDGIDDPANDYVYETPGAGRGR